MMDVVMYSSGAAIAFEADLDEAHEAVGREEASPSLVVTYDGHNKIRLFMPIEQMEALRDELNAKLPAAKALCA